MKYPILLLLSLVAAFCDKDDIDADMDSTEQPIVVPQADIIIDGKAEEAIWQREAWYPIDQRWLGPPYGKKDFQGRYQLAYDANYLYVLAEIQDDTLIDIHDDGLDQYWDDDCLEIFVDPDNSGGKHQYNHQAFAYHLSLDGRVADIGSDSLPIYLDEHVRFERRTAGNTSTWECAVRLYDDTFRQNTDNTPMRLQAGDEIGFALAYCDNDSSATRENFIGSHPINQEDKNVGWITADVFGTIRLAD